MQTKIQHAAIISENFVREARFFEAAFGMKRSKPGSEEEQKAIRTNYAVSVSDGYVGMTTDFLPRVHRLGPNAYGRTGCNGRAVALTIALGDQLGDGSWSVRIQYKPMIRFLWIGAFVMALGGMVSVSDRRYRKSKK